MIRWRFSTNKESFWKKFSRLYVGSSNGNDGPRNSSGRHDNNKRRKASICVVGILIGADGTDDDVDESERIKNGFDILDNKM